jgi:hypothetical protein
MPRTAQLVCEEQEKLLEDYQAVMGGYLATRRELRKKVHVLSKEDFDKAFDEMTELMLQDVAAARFRLEAHIYQHHC